MYVVKSVCVSPIEDFLNVCIIVRIAFVSFLAALARGEVERSLDQGKSLLRTIQSLSEVDLPNKTHFIATVHSCIGSASLELGDAETSLEHHLKDCAISKDLDSKEGLTRALDNLIKVYVVMGEFQEALNQ